jgi:hypothetical protein
MAIRARCGQFIPLGDEFTVEALPEDLLYLLMALTAVHFLEGLRVLVLHVFEIAVALDAIRLPVHRFSIAARLDVHGYFTSLPFRGEFLIIMTVEADLVFLSEAGKAQGGEECQQERDSGEVSMWRHWVLYANTSRVQSLGWIPFSSSLTADGHPYSSRNFMIIGQDCLVNVIRFPKEILSYIISTDVLMGFSEVCS